MHIVRVRIGAVAVALLGATVLAGCSDDDGDPFTTGQNTPLPGSSVPNAGQPNVPKVASPLNVEPYVDRPCDLVDKATVAEIGDMDSPQPDVDSDMAKRLTGPTCQWDATNGNLDIRVSIQTVHSQYAAPGLKGIAGIYGGKQNGLVDYLEPAEVPGHPGYPAVFAGQNSDKEFGGCPLYVGVADDMVFVARVSDRSEIPQDTCPATLKVAASVLQTLKAGS
jgi:hypothetical protein